MDDIYFWVLRVWRALTSNKLALVALVGVAAIVVTVTTVIAAPARDQEVESPDTFVSMQPPVLSEPVVMSMVALNPLEELTIGGVSSPGILPSSPFYFLKGIGRDMQYAFTFDPIDKANLKLRFANEDALAIRSMCFAGRYLEAAQQCFSYQDNFFTSLAWTVKAKKQGNDVEALMLNLRTAHHGHRLVLADALEMVDESQLEAVVGAITYTSAPFEQVIQWTQGADQAEVFHAKLRNDLSWIGVDVWLQIENRLGLDVEQAVALSKAMGNDTVASAPIISSVRPERFELDPGATVAISCAASDLSGGGLTYQWGATSGSLEGGDLETARWTAPDALGLYTVTVVVADERGNESTKSVNLRVGDSAQPTGTVATGPFSIEEMRAERDPSGRSAISSIALGQDWRSTERSVFIKSTIRITCEIDGSAEGLTYEWSADAGEIRGSGDSIVWVAPGFACKAQVSVVVSNDSGSEDRATVHFRASTCSNCFSW